MKNFLKKLFLINSIKKIIGLKNYEKIKNFLRFHGIHFFRYKVNENISFGSEVLNDLFEKELKSCKIYLEYGSGSSTLLAKKLNKNFFSIEGDKDFFRYMSKKISSEKLILKSLGIVKHFCIPIDMEFDVCSEKLITIKRKKQIEQYTNEILQFFEKINLTPDFILVDGRYRVLCGIYLYKFFKNKDVSFKIIFDDYMNRPYYHWLEKLFVIEKIGRFGVATKIKKDVKNIDTSHYFRDCR